jgi:molecular chaperone GrpE
MRWTMAENPEPEVKAEPEPAAAPSKPEMAADAARLERELLDARKRGEELYARLQYLQADFDNYRKRSERELELVVRNANEGLVSRLLPVLDDLDAAVASMRGKAGKGVAMVRENILKALREFGLEEIPAQGTAFDPYLHECIQQVADPAVPDGQVKEVVRKGYRFRARVLRPAQVTVAKKEDQSVEHKEGEPNA